MKIRAIIFFLAFGVHTVIWSRLSSLILEEQVVKFMKTMERTYHILMGVILFLNNMRQPKICMVNIIIFIFVSMFTLFCAFKLFQNRCSNNIRQLRYM